MLKLNVVNNGFTRTKWSLEAIPVGVYLKGERDSVHGMQKFILYCTNKKVVLHVMFDPQNREDEILKILNFDSLMIDGQALDVTKSRVVKWLQNGWINASYVLDSGHVGRLRTAKSVGLAMQGSPRALVFLGIGEMPFEDGAAKLGGFLKTCV